MLNERTIPYLLLLPSVLFLGLFFAWPLVEATYRAMRGDTFFNFELHAIDVVDETDGVPPQLVRQQRDLRVKASEKLKRLRALFGWLADDRDPVTVLDAARKLRTTA